jgi:hypothetical protein
MSKHRVSKPKQSGQDREDNRKFLMVLAVATVLLMLIMYFAFVR